MREDFQIPNFGEGPAAYEKGYLNRLVRNIEMTFRALKAKGPINATTIKTDSLTFPDGSAMTDYREGTWTPSLTFDTPGDLAITYGSRVGRVTKVGRMVHLSFVVTTSAFTHSTASGSFRITGMPFSAVSGWEQTGTTEHQNLNLSAPYYQVNLNLQSGRTDLRLVASGASAGRVALSTTHVPSGVNLTFLGQITYEANA